MVKQQPMKMAAAEALYKTTKGASLSIFAVGPFEHFPKRLETDTASRTCSRCSATSPGTAP